jgi:hypothetical protein
VAIIVPIRAQEAECRRVLAVSLRKDQAIAGDEQMNTENELSPTMKIFAWRGPSRGDMTETASRAATYFMPEVRPVITSAVQRAASLSSWIEIVIGGAVVRIMPGVDEDLLTRVLHVVRRPSESPPP